MGESQARAWASLGRPRGLAVVQPVLEVRVRVSRALEVPTAIVSVGAEEGDGAEVQMVVMSCGA